MAAMLDANDYFLANVAAFRVADRIVETSLRYDCVFIHVNAEAWDAGFDAQDFESFVSNDFCSSVPECIVKLFYRARLDEKIEPFFSRMRRANDRHFFFRERGLNHAAAFNCRHLFP